MFTSLLVFCLTAYIAKTSEEEMIRIFAITVAIISLVLGIVLSPWFVQILILISVFFWQSPLRNKVGAASSSETAYSIENRSS